MSRIKIEIPENKIAVIDIPVRITDINYGNHLGNDSLVGIIHEARVQWLKLMGYTELNIEDCSIIMSDIAVNYLNESFHGDLLSVSIHLGDLTSAGFELFYLIETTRDEKKITIAKAKTGIVFYDYKKRKIVPFPEAFKIRFTS